MKIKSIEIESERWDKADWNQMDSNADVWVTLSDKTEWVASFVTYKNVISLAEKNRLTGENLHGKYLWISDMVLIDELSRNRIEEVVAHLVENKLEEFKMIFSQCQ